jgi:hypothetical protein
MRSRNGNHPFPLKLFSLIFFSSLVLNASEFLISYRYVVKNSLLYNETLQISKAMTKCSGNAYDGIILESDGKKDLQRVIANNSERFIEYVHLLGLHVNYKDETINYQNSSTTILTLKTTCFKVDFNDNFAKISPLK